MLDLNLSKGILYAQVWLFCTVLRQSSFADNYIGCGTIHVVKATSRGPDQHAQVRRLIKAFAARKYLFYQPIAFKASGSGEILGDKSVDNNVLTPRDDILWDV